MFDTIKSVPGRRDKWVNWDSLKSIMASEGEHKRKRGGVGETVLKTWLEGQKRVSAQGLKRLTPTKTQSRYIHPGWKQIQKKGRKQDPQTHKE